MTVFEHMLKDTSLHVGQASQPLAAGVGGILLACKPGASDADECFMTRVVVSPLSPAWHSCKNRIGWMMLPRKLINYSPNCLAKIPSVEWKMVFYITDNSAHRIEKGQTRMAISTTGVAVGCNSVTNRRETVPLLTVILVTQSTTQTRCGTMTMHIYGLNIYGLSRNRISLTIFMSIFICMYVCMYVY